MAEPKIESPLPPLADDDIHFLREAASFFKNPSVVVKGMNWLGKPFEVMQSRLPASARTIISVAVKSALEKALSTAISTTDYLEAPGDTVTTKARNSGWMHKAATTLAGAAGGFAGLAGLSVELPLTTVMILRGICDQARIHGHDLNDLETRLECLIVFSFGAPAKGDESLESGYFAARAGLSVLVKQAAEQLARLTAVEAASAFELSAAPMVARLIGKIAERFEVRISQKFVAESVPIAGALGGGAINYALTDFYCEAARYHFAIRALEKIHGASTVRAVMEGHV